MEEDQEKILEETKRAIKEQAFFMRQGIESIKLRDALKAASKMLDGLKTSALSPKNYYAIFVQIFDEMRALEACFKEEHKRGRKMSDLYENVQHADGIIPRLYLLITVAAVYISTHEVPAKDLLSDVMEMIKGVQHPVKGLFLRYYFLKMCKDKLPDKGNEYEGEGGEFIDSMNVILNNLSEMNKLWIRLIPPGPKNNTKRDKERNDLKVVIGENLVRLSQLEGCTVEVYKEVVLDKLIEIILSKDDKISQQYLMDCIIQAFPDEYHIATLEKVLSTCATIMQNGVDIKTIFIRLMERLADYATGEEESAQSLDDLDLFNMFKKSIDSIIENQGATLELDKFLELQVAFLKFCTRLYPENIDYVNNILQSCCSLCQKQTTLDLDESSLRCIVNLLTYPLDSLSISVLQMEDYPKLMKYLPFLKRRTVSLKICQAVTSRTMPLNNLEVMTQIIQFLTPIFKDEKDTVDLDAQELEDEQNLVARLIHLVTHENPDEYFKLLEALRKEYEDGGMKRLFFTLPALFFAYIKLARYTQQCLEAQAANAEVEEFEQGPIKSIYDIKIVHYRSEFQLRFTNIFPLLKSFIEKLGTDHHEKILKLYLELIQIIDRCDPNKELDEETYHIFTQVLEIYQNDIADAELKVHYITIITSNLYRLTCLGEENYDGLAGNTASYCNKLLKKYHQALAVLDSSHLFYTQAQANEGRVMECFKKALKITDASFGSHPTSHHFHLYIAILNKFLYYFNIDSFQSIKADDVNKCIQVLREKQDKVNDKVPATTIYLKNTLDFINHKKSENPKFQEISI